MHIFSSCLIRCLCCFALAIIALLHSQPINANDNILVVLNSYNEAGPWSKDMILPVTSKMAHVPGISAELINLNCTLVRDSVDYNQMADDVFSRFKDKKPSYVVMIDNMAFTLMPRIKEEWGDIPVLLITKRTTLGESKDYYTGIPYKDGQQELVPLESLRDKYNFTIVHVPDMYQETIDLMVKLMPDMHKFVFMADEVYINRLLNHKIEEYMKSTYPEIEYEWLVGNEENASKMREYWTSTDHNIGMLISSWFYTRMGVHGHPVLVAGDFYMLPASKQPVFSLRDSYLNYGAIGGVYPDPLQIRAFIDEALDHIVAGVDPRDLPFYLPDKYSTVLSYPQFMESQLNEKNIPHDALLYDKPLSFFDKYRWQIILAISIIVLLFISGLMALWLQRHKMTWLQSFHRLVSNMPIPYSEATIVYGLNGHIKDIAYKTSNNAFLQLIENNSTGHKNYKLFTGRFIAPFVQSLINSKEPITFTHYFPESDTYYQFIMCLVDKDDTNHPENIDIFGIDITDKCKTELSLKESARKLDLTLNAARIIPWQWDLVKHEIYCEAHRVFKNINVHSRFLAGEMTYVINEEDYLSNVHPDDKPIFEKIKQDFIDGVTTHQKLEFRMVYSRKGHQFIEWFEVNVAVGQVNDNGHVLSLMGSLLIITERKRQESALIDATNRAKESDNLKSAFLANMSHEIRTPLNAIVGFSNLLAETSDMSKKAQFATIINDNNNLLLQLINDVLDLAKIESNTLDFILRPTDINAVMNMVSDTISLRIPKGVAFNVVATREICNVTTDANRLAQVLINLLSNACKFTHKGSITLSYEVEDDHLLFEVKDTGIGLSEEDQKKLFKRFSKLNAFVQGNGLGLSISKSIINKLGGEIGVKSKGPGYGSTFWFTIPYKPSEAPCSERHQVQEKVAIQGNDRFTILVADDNDSNFMLLDSILADKYNVIRAKNGAEAVELCRALHPTLVLMDLNMPVMDGYKATEEIRKFDKIVPIIAVTAYALASDRRKVENSRNFDSYMSKPIDSHSLLTQINSLIKKNFLLI